MVFVYPKSNHLSFTGGYICVDAARSEFEPRQTSFGSGTTATAVTPTKTGTEIQKIRSNGLVRIVRADLETSLFTAFRFSSIFNEQREQIINYTRNLPTCEKISNNNFLIFLSDTLALEHASYCHVIVWPLGLDRSRRQIFSYSSTRTPSLNNSGHVADFSLAKQLDFPKIWRRIRPKSCRHGKILSTTFLPSSEHKFNTIVKHALYVVDFYRHFSVILPSMYLQFRRIA